VYACLLGVDPDMLSAAILPAALSVLALLPLYLGLSKRTVQSVAMAGLGIAVILALWIRYDPIAATVPLY